MRERGHSGQLLGGSRDGDRFAGGLHLVAHLCRPRRDAKQTDEVRSRPPASINSTMSLKRKAVHGSIALTETPDSKRRKGPDVSQQPFARNSLPCNHRQAIAPTDRTALQLAAAWAFARRRLHDAKVQPSRSVR